MAMYYGPYIKEGTQAQVIWEQDPDTNIWAQKG